MGKDKIRQFEIIFIELNRYLAYGERNYAIKCYNKLHEVYNHILDSDMQHDEKHRLYTKLIESHQNINFSPKPIIGSSEVAFMSICIFISSILLFTSPELTSMFIAQQKPNIVKNIYIFSTLILILLPITIIYLKNTIKNRLI